MLEMTIGTLERENVARQNQTDTFDLRNLERNLFQFLKISSASKMFHTVPPRCKPRYDIF